jgi:uncharacterized protein YbaP (TraB family)
MIGQRVAFRYSGRPFVTTFALMSHLSRRAVLLPVMLFLCSFRSWAAEPSSPAFWEIAQGNAKVYMFGSMHFGHADFYPLPEVVEKAFEGADRLVVEVDILNITPQTAAQAIFKYGGLPPDKQLAHLLSPETFQALDKQAQKNGLAVKVFERFQPWYVSLMLVEAEIRKTELQQQLGIDWYFLQRARGKQVDELESIESQLALFGGLTDSEQEEFLRQTLKDLEHSRTYLMAMAQAWRQGDLASLETTLIEPFQQNPQTKTLFDRIFTQRNLRMADRIRTYLKGEDQVFFVVGVGHMLGKGGIVALLQESGIRVRRVSLSSNLPSHR